MLNKVENSPPLTPPISAPYSKEGPASMRAWRGGARCTLRLETPIIATASTLAANPATSDVDKCARLSPGPNYTSTPCQITSLEIELGKIADVLDQSERKHCKIVKLP